MALVGPSGEDRSVPLAAFAFHVSFVLEGFAAIPAPLLGGFTDVTGLEATMEPKVINVGGSNYGPVQRAGPVTFATVVLKRGVIQSRHLWKWWESFTGAKGGNGAWGPASRAEVTIALLRGASPVFGWKLRRAMPVKFRAGDLNAQAGELAVEELHLAHEGLTMESAA
jgi:phage tail-like protein